MDEFALGEAAEVSRLVADEHFGAGPGGGQLVCGLDRIAEVRAAEYQYAGISASAPALRISSPSCSQPLRARECFVRLPGGSMLATRFGQNHGMGRYRIAANSNEPGSPVPQRTRGFAEQSPSRFFLCA